MPESYIYPTGFRRVSWGAIFGGSIVAIMVSLLLGLLAITIGLATMHPMQDSGGQATDTMALISWLVITFLSLLAGGCVAGHLCGAVKRSDAVLHGVITWGVVTMVVLFTISSAAGKVFSGTANFLAGAYPMSQLNQAAQQMEPAGAGRESTAPAKNPQDSDEAAAPSSSSQSTTPAQPSQQTENKIISGAQQGTLWGLVALVVGGLAAAIGGRIGVPRSAYVVNQPAA